MVEETVDDEIAFIKETKVLDGYSLEDRENYVFKVIEAFSTSVEDNMKIKGKIKQAKRWKKMNEELKSGKGAVIVVCALYAVKKRYRPLFVSLLRVVTGIEGKVEMPS